MKSYVTLILLCLNLTALRAQVFEQDFSKQSRHLLYGEDNRYETDDFYDNLFRDKAKSVAAMVAPMDLRPDYDGDPEHYTTFFKKTAQRNANVCESERFSQQYAIGYCTGFLVAEDILVTAGHCVTEMTPCESFKWVFDYKDGITTFPNKDIYGCKEVLERQETSFRDYAVIRLDRPVKDRKPLEFRRDNKRVKLNTPLVIIGHPMGLPQKIADQAEVKLGPLKQLLEPITSLKERALAFYTNTDSYVGNSGSPIFNAETGLVEGLLFEGDDDFAPDNEESCYRSITKKDSHFSAEERAFRINRIEFLKNL